MKKVTAVLLGLAVFGCGWAAYARSGEETATVYLKFIEIVEPVAAESPSKSTVPGIHQLAAPRLIVPMGQPAGVTITYEPSKVVQATVKVNPADAGSLELTLKASIASAGSERALSTQLRVRDGEPILAGMLGFSSTGKESKRTLVLVSATRSVSSP